MAPNWGVSICYGRQAQVESFLLTKVIPQSPNLNRGLWETLEKIISNDYAERFGQVWVNYEQAVKSFQPYAEIKEQYQEARDAMAKLLTPAGPGHPKRRYIYVNNRLEGCAPKTIYDVISGRAATPAQS